MKAVATDTYRAEGGTVTEVWGLHALRLDYRPDGGGYLLRRTFAFRPFGKPAEAHDLAERTANAEPQGGDPEAIGIALTIAAAIQEMAAEAA